MLNFFFLTIQLSNCSLNDHWCVKNNQIIRSAEVASRNSRQILSEKRDLCFKQKLGKKMKKIIAAIIFVLAPAVSLAGGHSALGGSGTGVRVDLKTIEGTSGTHVQITTNDIWMYENPPEGFPEAMRVTCNYFQVFATGQQPPIGGIGACQTHDPDGDISLNTGIFQPNGTIAVTITAGTGKWAALTGAKFQGKTRNSLDGGTVYDFVPVN